MLLTENIQQVSDADYNDSIAFLDSLQFHKIKLGLAPMRDFLKKVGHPEEKLKIIHAAGTNGKGSVCSGLVSVLSRSGYRVGLYTSPHLSSPRERFCINDSFISKSDFSRLTGKIRKVLDGGQITYFEFTTALALMWFAEQEVDFVVLETGLGGRLDATNVIEKPFLTIITSVSMDHEMYLGDTIELVAAEKAGIIKESIPVICGSRDSHVVAVVEDFAKRLNAPLFCLEQDFDTANCSDLTWDYVSYNHELFPIKEIKNSKPGIYQADNSAIVVTAIQLLRKNGVTVAEDVLRQGITAAKWPGRLEYIEREIAHKSCRFLLDGAHNPAGVKSLIHSLQYYSYKKLYCIWGAMADKNFVDGLNEIIPYVDQMILADVNSDRAANATDMYNLVDKNNRGKILCCSTSTQAIEQACLTAEETDLILIAGSLYLIGEVRPQLAGELVS